MDELSILCSGNPYPWPWGYGSAYVLRVGEQRLMFDCGPAATDKLVKMGMMPYDIDNLFFTHHHFDHDVDYPCFLLTRWDSGSGKDNLLHVYGPNLTEQLTERILDKDVGAFAHDWTARINHPLSLGAYTSRGGILPRKPPVVDAKDVGPGKVADSGDWEVVSAPAYHVQPWLDSLAYRVNTSSGSVVFTGDTAPCESVTTLAKDADVLVVSCLDLQEHIDGTPEGEYMCGTTNAAKMAAEAGVKKLVLVHNALIARHGKMELGIADVAKEFDGEIIFGQELLSVKL